MMELVNMLTSQLGVTDQQAQGGAGAILNLAKEKLDAGQFGQLSAVLPGMDQLIQAAPKAGGIGGALGALASKLGGGGDKLGGLAGLAGSFSKLDLDAGIIGKFVPVVLSYFESKGGGGLKTILQSVLK